MVTCIYVAESLLCLPEVSTTVLIGYMPILIKKLNKIHHVQIPETYSSFNDLLNVSVYLNDGWQPDWSQPDKKYIVCLQKDQPEVKEVSEPCNLVYFKSEEAARQAIELLGEEKVATLLKGII